MVSLSPIMARRVACKEMMAIDNVNVEQHKLQLRRRANFLTAPNSARPQCSKSVIFCDLHQSATNAYESIPAELPAPDPVHREDTKNARNGREISGYAVCTMPGVVKIR